MSTQHIVYKKVGDLEISLTIILPKNATNVPVLLYLDGEGGLLQGTAQNWIPPPSVMIATVTAPACPATPPTVLHSAPSLPTTNPVSTSTVFVHRGIIPAPSASHRRRTNDISVGDGHSISKGSTIIQVDDWE
jgi:hypothetical protein